MRPSCNALLCLLCLLLPAKVSWRCCAKEAGIFYSTLYAKTMEPERLTGFAGDATAWFLYDINGDGRDDAVAYFGEGEKRGQWWTALSDGQIFGAARRLKLGESRPPAGDGMTGDVNGDGKIDKIAFEKTSGRWAVALATDNGHAEPTVWREDFGRDADFGFVCDVNGDGKTDIGYLDNGAWYVSYASRRSFSPRKHRWITGLLQSESDPGRDKQNRAPVVAALTGSIDGKNVWACVVDQDGGWYSVRNPQQDGTFALAKHNTWAAWRCSYRPQISGQEGTYDSGDSEVQDAQIRMMHDAGFTYVTLDITNGNQDWIDERAHAFFNRIRHWNSDLGPGDHKMYANIALGRTRGVEGEDPFFAQLNLECKRAWSEFYLPYKDVFYHLQGKPLVIHMITTGLKEGYYKDFDTWQGDRTYIERVCCRWMAGWNGCTSKRANFYGWDVREKFGNPIHKEMMPVMPGFWNGNAYVDREGGAFYRSQWMRVIKHQPESVWVNSLNETWEHTSIEPALMFNARGPREGITMWTDAYGDRMDDFYWVMTRQYMKLYMEDALYEGTVFQEQGNRPSSPLYRVAANGFIRQYEKPRQAPVLLLPKGFRQRFAGAIVPRP